MHKLFSLLSFFVVLNVSAQQNLKWLKLKNYKVSTLSDSLRENSGLTFYGDRLYTFNDGGNSSEIFEIDKNSGKILKKIKTNLPNKDWEAIANDGENFFIGDFGNNAGNRKDLVIYKIPFQDNSIQKDSIKTISFKYPEQTDFSAKNLQTNFDAEAMIYSDIDQLVHVFTKEWQSKNISHYLINPLNFSEEQNAKKWETAELGFVATDASFYDRKLFVVGYTKKAEVFLAVFEEDENDGSFFKNPPQKFYLGSATKIGQVEGIAVNSDGIYISSEKFKTPLGTVLPTLYFIPKEKFSAK